MIFGVGVGVGVAAGVTVKFVELVAVPPAVVTVIGPVVAPAGTFVVICVSVIESMFAAMPLKLTTVFVASGSAIRRVCADGEFCGACVPGSKLSPVIITVVPTAPFVGKKLRMCGSGSPTVILICASTVQPLASVTVIVKVKLPD